MIPIRSLATPESRLVSLGNADRPARAARRGAPGGPPAPLRWAACRAGDAPSTPSGRVPRTSGTANTLLPGNRCVPRSSSRRTARRPALRTSSPCSTLAPMCPGCCWTAAGRFRRRKGGDGTGAAQTAGRDPAAQHRFAEDPEALRRRGNRVWPRPRLPGPGRTTSCTSASCSEASRLDVRDSLGEC